MIFPSYHFFTEDAIKKIGAQFLNLLIPFFTAKCAPKLLAAKSVEKSLLTTRTTNTVYQDELKLTFGIIFIEYISGRSIETYLTEKTYIPFIHLAIFSTGIDPAQLNQDAFNNFLQEMKEKNKREKQFYGILHAFFKNEEMMIYYQVIDEIEEEVGYKKTEEDSSLPHIAQTKIVKVLEAVLNPPFDWSSQDNSLRSFIKAIIKNALHKKREEFASIHELTIKAKELAEKLEIDSNNFQLELEPEATQDLIFFLNLLAPYIDLEAIDSLQSPDSPQSTDSPQSITTSPLESIFEKLEKVIEVSTKHYTPRPDDTQPASSTEGYTITNIEPDGDCGYSCLNVSRNEAFDLISSQLHDPKIQSLLSILLEETFLLDKQGNDFLNYLKSKNLLSQDTTFENFIANKETFKTNQEILQAYLEFDIKDKNIDDGWAHPLILHILAHIKKINLNLWQAEPGNGKLKPHIQYSTSQSPGSQITVNLLFHSATREEKVSNHFDVITIKGNGLYPIPQTVNNIELNLAIINQTYYIAYKTMLFFLGQANLIEKIAYNLEKNTTDLKNLITQATLSAFQKLSDFTSNLAYLAETAANPLFKNWVNQKIIYIQKHISPEQKQLITISTLLLQSMYDFFGNSKKSYLKTFFIEFKDTMPDLLRPLAEHFIAYIKTIKSFQKTSTDIQLLKNNYDQAETIDFETANQLTQTIETFCDEEIEDYEEKITTLLEEINIQSEKIENQILDFQTSESFQAFLREQEKSTMKEYINVINTLKEFVDLFDQILNLYTKEIKDSLPSLKENLEDFVYDLNTDLVEAILAVKGNETKKRQR